MHAIDLSVSTGPASPPRNLSHTFDSTCNETHVNTTFSWVLPQQNQDSYSAESLTLTLTAIDDDDDLETSMTVEDISLVVTATSVSVYLEVNATYSVSLYVTSCRGGVNSSEYTLSTDDLNCTAGSF